MKPVLLYLRISRDSDLQIYQSSNLCNYLFYRSCLIHLALFQGGFYFYQ